MLDNVMAIEACDLNVWEFVAQREAERTADQARTYDRDALKGNCARSQ